MLNCARMILGMGTWAALAVWANGTLPAAAAEQEEAAEQEKAAVSLQAFDDVEPLEFEWGWIRWLMNAERDPDAEMTLGVVQIKPNQSNPLHLHPHSAEYLHVLSGKLEHRIGDRWFG